MADRLAVSPGPWAAPVRWNHSETIHCFQGSLILLWMAHLVYLMKLLSSLAALNVLPRETEAQRLAKAHTAGGE